MKYAGIVSSGLIAFAFIIPVVANAQTASQNQLRATIQAEITSDPRSQTMTEAQIYGLVNALTSQADQQGITASQLSYAPETFQSQTSTLEPCTDISCSLARAFGLDGSFPIIPLAFFIVAALFILIYGIMREMGHPHTLA